MSDLGLELIAAAIIYGLTAASMGVLALVDLAKRGLRSRAPPPTNDV